MNTLSNKRKGFTLVELVVVIAIIGILLAIAVPKLTQYRASAQERAMDANARQLFTAAQSYAYADTQVAAAAAAGQDTIINSLYDSAALTPYLTTSGITITTPAKSALNTAEANLISAVTATGQYAVDYGEAGAAALLVPVATNVMIVVTYNANSPSTPHRIYYDGVFDHEQ